MRRLRAVAGDLLRRWADRIDYAGAPKATSLAFTFEPHRGMVIRESERGCTLWYLGDDQYERAHTEAVVPHAVVDWVSVAAGQSGDAVSFRGGELGPFPERTVEYVRDDRWARRDEGEQG